MRRAARHTARRASKGGGSAVPGVRGPGPPAGGGGDPVVAPHPQAQRAAERGGETTATPPTGFCGASVQFHSVALVLNLFFSKKKRPYRRWPQEKKRKWHSNGRAGGRRFSECNRIAESAGGSSKAQLRRFRHSTQAARTSHAASVRAGLSSPKSMQQRISTLGTDPQRRSGNRNTRFRRRPLDQKFDELLFRDGQTSSSGRTHWFSRSHFSHRKILQREVVGGENSKHF